MKYLLKLCLYTLGVVVLNGCVADSYDGPDVPVETLKYPSSSTSSSQSYRQKDRILKERKMIALKKDDLANADDLVYRKLMSHYRDWKGVRYEMGGLSKRGVDCSGFVFKAYQSRLGMNIPRSTELQSQVGEKVKRSQLKTGDLVFFKTSYKVRHVGIYLEDGDFMHASSSRGVMISNLSNVYWNKKYWKARRLLAQI